MLVLPMAWEKLSQAGSLAALTHCSISCSQGQAGLYPGMLWVMGSAPCPGKQKTVGKFRGKVVCRESAEGNFPQRITAVLIAEERR